MIAFQPGGIAVSADFVALDVETANADCSSVCQIGYAVVRIGELADAFSVLVDLQDHFDPINTSIHGLTAAMVRGSPTFDRAFEAVRTVAAGGFVVSHTAFDRTAVDRACARCGAHAFAARWLDSARMARRAWPDQFAERGYGLSNVARFLKIDFRHHDADEDARAAAEIVLAALRHSALGLEEWEARVRQPISVGDASSRRLEGNAEGAFAGEALVFTGVLSIPRREAAAMAAAVGFDETPSVSKKVGTVVVGAQDARRLNGVDKSSKHRKAEELIAQGQDIRIITEDDFRQIVEAAECEAGACSEAT